MRKFNWVVASLPGLWLCSAILGAMVQSSATATSAIAAPSRAAADTVSSFPSAAPSEQAAPIHEAQARPPAPAAPPKPATQEPPRKVETTTYDSWTVTCDTTAGGAKKKCLASLRIVQNRGLVLNWEIGSNAENRYITAIHIPSALAMKQGDKTVGGPIMVGNGIELKFGNGTVRRLSFVTCGPKQCVAEGLIDDAFVKEASANTKATLTVYTPSAAIPLELAINGIDKAISSTR